MLYILGGASRSGKSTIAHRLVVERRIPFFCTDYLVTILQEGVPFVEIKQGQNIYLKAKRLWPILKPLLVNHLIKADLNYLIEGDGILPRYVSKLLNEYPNRIKVCFVGYSAIDQKNKFQEVKKFGGRKDDWTKYFSDEDLLRHIKDMIKFSKYLKTESQKYNIHYFDSSENFNAYLEEVFNYLII